MSKSVSIYYRDQDFWAFDLVTSILLKHLVDLAEPHVSANSPWLAEAVQSWRVNTVMPDCFGFSLDEAWSQEQIEVVIGLIDSTCAALEKRAVIPANEIESWRLLDGMHIFARGLPSIQTKCVIKLGRAIILLLRGALPPAPSGTWWWYGVDDHAETISKGKN